MPTQTHDIPELAAEFTAAHPELSPTQQRLMLASFRLLGEGKPVGPDILAERVDLPIEEVTSSIVELPMVHRDERGRIVALGGLSLAPTSHVLEVDGRRLYAWCALDTLFLPELLGHPARVHSTCPETGEKISLTVDSAGVHDVEPPGAVMSLHGIRGFDLDDVIRTFCCYVHFFASEQAAVAWTAGRQGAYVVSVAEGFEYGRLYNRGRFPAAFEAGKDDDDPNT
ncbi:MAG: alkylmercury lyase MerB [Thermoanaerobaculia bacterium]